MSLSLTLVVDASVAVKWFFVEASHAAARSLLDRREVLIAPWLILAEITSATWKRFRRKEIARTEADPFSISWSSRFLAWR